MKPSTYKIYELKESSTNSWFRIAPERGGLVTSIGLKGKEILYLNEETFLNPDSNVRGGVPILFPICDWLENKEYKLNNEIFQMKNHGFARNLEWTVESVNEESITLVLESSEETNKQYPFDFNITFKFILQDGVFTIEQEYHNQSNNSMPFYAGFHPYFKAEDKNVHLETDAESYYDVNDHQLKKLDASLDLRETTEACILLDSKERKISFPISAEDDVTLEYGEEFKYVTLWSEPGKEFICVEPWMAKPNSFNTLEDVQWLEPNESMQTFLKFALRD